jgi:hypothetical protein
LKGMQNISPADVVLERGFIKLDKNLLVHVFILL